MAECKPIEDTSNDAVANPADGAAEEGQAGLNCRRSNWHQSRRQRRSPPSQSWRKDAPSPSPPHLTRPTYPWPLRADTKLHPLPRRKLLRRTDEPSAPSLAPAP